MSRADGRHLRQKGERRGVLLRCVSSYGGQVLQSRETGEGGNVRNLAHLALRESRQFSISTPSMWDALRVQVTRGVSNVRVY